MWILSCAQLKNTYSKLTNSFLVTAVALSTAKTTNSEKAIYFSTLMSCSINKVLHVIHMRKFYVFRFYMEKRFLLHEMVWKERRRVRGGGVMVGIASPPNKHVMNICFSSKFSLRIPSVLSSFLHAIWSALSSLFPSLFLLHQNENLFKSLKQWNNLVGI